MCCALPGVHCCGARAARIPPGTAPARAACPLQTRTATASCAPAHSPGPAAVDARPASTRTLPPATGTITARQTGTARYCRADEVRCLTDVTACQRSVAASGRHHLVLPPPPRPPPLPPPRPYRERCLPPDRARVLPTATTVTQTSVAAPTTTAPMDTRSPTSAPAPTSLTARSVSTRRRTSALTTLTTASDSLTVTTSTQIPAAVGTSTASVGIRSRHSPVTTTECSTVGAVSSLRASGVPTAAVLRPSLSPALPVPPDRTVCTLTRVPAVAVISLAGHSGSSLPLCAPVINSLTGAIVLVPIPTPVVLSTYPLRALSVSVISMAFSRMSPQGAGRTTSVLTGKRLFSNAPAMKFLMGNCVLIRNCTPVLLHER